MKRGKPLRRVPFRRRAEGPTAPREAHPVALSPSRALVKGTYAGGTAAAAPKAKPVRSEAYRRLVAALPCAHCFVFGRSQAAHADQTKGLGTKTDDRTCYPACGPAEGHPGCHWLIGTSGHIQREERRALEQLYAKQTRAKIINRGLWPPGLPKWGEI